MKLDDVDKRLLDIIQERFPIVERPFLSLAQELGVCEREVMSRIGYLKEQGLIRRIGAGLDSRKLGYSGTLCAMKVPPERIGEVAEIVNRYPGVTHNYIREHIYNMWFTVLGESSEDIEGILEEIRTVTGIAVISLPAKTVFKVRVTFKTEVSGEC